MVDGEGHDPASVDVDSSSTSSEDRLHPDSASNSAPDLDRPCGVEILIILLHGGLLLMLLLMLLFLLLLIILKNTNGLESVSASEDVIGDLP